MPLPRRTWTSGKITFHAEMCAGDAIRRVSKISQVEVTGGEGGRACRVTVQHNLTANGRAAVSEEQVIEYGGRSFSSTSALASRGTSQTNCAVNIPMLFRYAALTFNADRIHYDLAYAMGEGGAPGVIVSGPLQATFMIAFAGALLKAPVRSFSFSDCAPLIAPQDGIMEIHAAQAGNGLKLWTAAPGGRQAMVAEALT